MGTSPLDLKNMIFSSSTSTTLLALLLPILLLLIKKLLTARPSHLPPHPKEAPGSWPILGHLHLLGGSLPPHKVLGNLADRYGPIFKIRLGTRPVIVASTPEMAKEFLQTHDKDFASRPKLVAFELLTYNYAMFGLTPFSSYWREVRKISTLELLSTQRLNVMKNVKVQEARRAIHEVFDKWERSKAASVTEEMREWVGNVTMNTVLQVVVSKSLNDESGERCLHVLRDFFRLAGVFTMGDAFPYLRWMDIGGHEKLMKKTAKEIDFFAQGWLDTHRRDRAVNAVGKDKDKHDFMDTLIDVFDSKDTSEFGYDPDTIIKAVCFTLILAAGDATSVTITWALCLLLNNPQTLKKVQQELDTQVGRDRRLEISDMESLTYTQAVIRETLRLYPPAPLSVPHEALADVTVAGYGIPVGTQVFVNLHKVQRDPRAWPEPDEFRPERFLTTHKDVDLKGHHFEFIPFSSGRRICPGIGYALQVVPYTLAALLHSFDIATKDGGRVDVTETGGLTSLKATPFEVLLTPRLPHHLYETTGG